MFKNPYNVISLLLQFVNKIIGIQIITFLKVRIMIKENNYVLFHFFIIVPSLKFIGRERFKTWVFVERYSILSECIAQSCMTSEHSGLLLHKNYGTFLGIVLLFGELIDL